MGEATHHDAPAPQRSGWDRVPHAPGMKKALRVGLAATVAFFVGRFVFDDPQTAVFGALGSIALLVLADFGGAIAVRARAYVISIVIATGLVTLGTLVSKDTILAACALFVVALVVSLIAVIGRNAAGGAKAIILFFVVACAVPAPDAEIPARIVGVLVGGGLSIAAALLMWPDRAGRDFRALLGTAAKWSESSSMWSARPVRAPVPPARAPRRSGARRWRRWTRQSRNGSPWPSGRRARDPSTARSCA